MNKRFVLPMVFLLIWICAPIVWAATPAEVIGARASVVRVESDAGYGSGFVVAVKNGETIIATNLHVLESTGRFGNVIATDDTPQIHAGEQSMKATVIEMDAGPDLALLSVYGLISEPLALENTDTVAVGQDVYALGFPGIADIQNNGKLLPSAPSDVTITSGTVSKDPGYSQLLEMNLIQIDCNIDHGNSGGPLLNEAGSVIGVNSYGLNNINYAISANYIIDTLDELGYALSAESGPAEAPAIPEELSNILPWAMFISMIAAAMFFIILIICFIVDGSKTVPSLGLVISMLLFGIGGFVYAKADTEPLTTQRAEQRTEQESDGAEYTAASKQIIGEESKQQPDNTQATDESSGNDASYIIPDSNTEYLREADLRGMDSVQLRLARNEIFARHGYAFRSKDLQEYFGKKSWYKPIGNNDSIKLNTIEMYNVELIKSYENRE
jgi:hypothetical protein